MNTNQFLFKVFFAFMINAFALQAYATQNLCPSEGCGTIREQTLCPQGRCVTVSVKLNNQCMKLKMEGQLYPIILPDGNFCYCHCSGQKAAPVDTKCWTYREHNSCEHSSFNIDKPAQNERVCQGPWAYRQFNSCEDSSFGIESYKKDRTEICGVEIYKEGSSEVCGVELYREDRRPPCDVELYNERENHLCGFSHETKRCVRKHADFAHCINGCTCRITATTKHYHRCRHEKFGAESHKLCRHSDFGVETHKRCRHPSFGAEYKECEHETHGVEKYKTGIGAVCGIDETTFGYTERGIAFPSCLSPYLLEKPPFDLNTSEGTGSSACTTCDDVVVTDEITTDEIKKKQVQNRYICLEARVSPFHDLPFELKAVVKALLELQVSHSLLLTDEQHDFIFSLLTDYPEIVLDDCPIT